MHAQSDNQFLTELSDLTQCKYCLKSFPTPFAMQTHIEEVSTFTFKFDAFVIGTLVSLISLMQQYMLMIVVFITLSHIPDVCSKGL
jgi:hypothetical protein